jgi:hypothetical protein
MLDTNATFVATEPYASFDPFVGRPSSFAPSPVPCVTPCPGDIALIACLDREQIATESHRLDKQVNQQEAERLQIWQESLQVQSEKQSALDMKLENEKSVISKQRIALGVEYYRTLQSDPVSSTVACMG